MGHLNLRSLIHEPLKLGGGEDNEEGGGISKIKREGEGGVSV